MLTVVPKRRSSSQYEVRDSGGQRVGDMQLAPWLARGTIWIGDPDCAYHISREGGFFGPIVLEGRGGKIARAVRLSSQARAFAMEHGQRVYILRSPSILYREMWLFEDDRMIGTAIPENVLGRRAQVDLPESIPPEIRLFVAWLAYFVWRRWQNASLSFAVPRGF
jgi:hypothetical protein